MKKRTTNHGYKTRNPIARILKYFTPKRFKDKKKYERKKYVWKRNDLKY